MGNEIGAYQQCWIQGSFVASWVVAELAVDLGPSRSWCPLLSSLEVAQRSQDIGGRPEFPLETHDAWMELLVCTWTD
eukprot:1767052-Amphidinium_carterae.1